MKDFIIFTLRDVVRFSDYHTYPFKGIAKRIIDENITNCDILYWAPLEPIDSPFNHSENYKGVDDFETLIKSRDIQIYVIHSDYNTNIIELENVYVLKWKTSLLHYCKSSAEFKYKKSIQNIRIDDSNFKKLFSSLNLGVRPTRVFLLDNLYKNGLFDYGDISWNHLTTEERFSDLNLKFNYWKETKLKVDLDIIDYGVQNQVHDNHLWTEYYLNSNCLFSIQSESIVHDGGYGEKQFLSEKTWKPLLLGQPFLNIGSCGYYNYLQEFGFKLYDEIIDYSFDSICNTEERILSITSQLEKLKDEDYNLIYKKIKSKIDYNRNLVLSILKKDTYIPNEFENFYIKHKNKMDSLSNVEMNMDLKDIFGYLK